MPRERRDFIRISGIRDPSLIVIATEGEKTEQQYFEGLQEKCETSPSRIHLKILEPRTTGHSSPKYVLSQLSDYKKEFGLNSNDELCMVIDRDSQSWTEAELSLVAAQCESKQFVLALSNPCFEVWLLLHIKDIDEYSQQEISDLFSNKNEALKKEIRKLLGQYNPSNLNFSDFIESIDTAIHRASVLDTDPQARWPNNFGTRVYVPVKKIMESM